MKGSERPLFTRLCLVGGYLIPLGYYRSNGIHFTYTWSWLCHLGFGVTTATRLCYPPLTPYHIFHHPSSIIHHQHSIPLTYYTLLSDTFYIPHRVRASWTTT